MQGAYNDIWSPPSSDFSGSSHPSDADDELDDDMSRASIVEREESTNGGESGRDSPSPSVYSYHSSIDGKVMLRDIHGRMFNNTSDHYMLPADVAEHGRLDLQHEMLKKMRGGLFYAPKAVKRALEPREGSQPSILDVGSGSGSWVIEMGKLFPHVEVVGLDLVPANLSSFFQECQCTDVGNYVLYLLRTPSPNCRFECDDANLGLLHYRESFDIVHASCVALGITNYREFMDEAVQILRPGGVHLTVEGDMHIHDENHNALPLINEGEPGFTYTLRLVHAIRDAMRARGPGIDAYPKIYDWLKEQGDVWETIGQKVRYIPLGPWEDNMSAKDKYVSELMRQDFFRMIQSVRPMLLSYGWFDETVDKWSAGAHEEIKLMRNKYYIRWFFTWAIKPGLTT